MKVRIDSRNIDEYRRSTYPYPCVTKIVWLAGELDSTVLKQFSNAVELDCRSNKLRGLCGIEILTKLQVLNCAHNKLVSMYPIRALNLRILKCRANWLDTIEGIQGSTNLEVLDCSFNRLSSLKKARNCRLLQDLDCQCNRLKCIQVIECFPGLTKLDCSTNPLYLIPPIEGLTSLTALRCNSCKLKSIENLSVYTSLETLYCIGNNLTSLKGIEPCTNLTGIHCGYNRLGTLNELGPRPNLRILSCARNYLTSLAGIETCVNLTEVDCYYNNLTTLDELRACLSISTLNCSHNQLSSIDGISSCTLLHILNCERNSITSIDALIPLTNLTELRCGSNVIDSLDPVIYLRKLTYFMYDSNPLGIQSERCQRYLEQFQFRYRYAPKPQGSRNQGTIYSNNQNVHDIHVQQSVCKSLVHILADPKPTFDMMTSITDANVDDRVKQLLISYCRDRSAHSVHMISYEELLGYVWNRIVKSEHSIELFKILSQQVLDSDGMCFTGRFNRTLSILVGFYPDIVIEISDTSRIAAIILTIQKRINPYDPVTHAETATIELQQAGYNADEIKPWIDAIHDSQ